MTKMGIQFRLLGVVMICSMIIIGTLVTYGVSNYRAQIYQAQQQKIESIIRTIDVQVNTEKDLKEMDKFRKLFSYLMEYDSQLLQINLIAPIHGEYFILASNYAKQIGKKVPPEELDVIRSGKTRLVEPPSAKYIEITAPIHVNTNPIAAMSFYLDISQQTKMLQQVTIRMVIFGLVGTGLLMGFLYMFLTNYILTPLRHLGEITQKVASGDFSQRVHIADRAELSQLGREFNQMADRLLQRYQQGIIDQSTGLNNYFFVKERLAEEIKRIKPNNSLAFMLIDFHEVFSWGRLTGEYVAIVIKELSQIVKEILPENYICGRYSNRELAIIGPGLSPEGTLELAELFHEKITNTLVRKDISGFPKGLNIIGIPRVGIAMVPEEGIEVEELVLRAEVALEVAGIDGKGIIVFYEELMEIEGAPVCSQLVEKYGRKRSVKLLQALGEIIQNKEIFGRSHSSGVAKYAIGMGVAIGLPPEEINDITTAALLHDIGGLCYQGNEDNIQLGATLVARAGASAKVVESISFQKEAFDGKGPSEGIQGENIPIGSRIIAIADKFEHYLMATSPITPDRIKEGMDYLKKLRGKELDPELVDVFINLLETENTQVIEILA